MRKKNFSGKEHIDPQVDMEMVKEKKYNISEKLNNRSTVHYQTFIIVGRISPSKWITLLLMFFWCLVFSLCKKKSSSVKKTQVNKDLWLSLPFLQQIKTPFQDF